MDTDEKTFNNYCVSFNALLSYESNWPKFNNKKNPYHFMRISNNFLPLLMVLRSAFPRYSTEAGAGLVSKKSVFASIKPAMAAPTAPRPSDHMPIASVSPSRTDDDTAGKI